MDDVCPSGRPPGGRRPGQGTVARHTRRNILMDALNTEMAGHAGHVNKVVPFAPPPAAAIPITGNCLESELRGKTPKERAYLAAQLVSGTLNLVQPTSVQGARLVNTGPGLVHRALGHPVRPPIPPGRYDLLHHPLRNRAHRAADRSDPGGRGGRDGMNRRARELVSDACAILAAHGFTATVDSSGRHLKIRWTDAPGPPALPGRSANPERLPDPSQLASDAAPPVAQRGMVALAPPARRTCHVTDNHQTSTPCDARRANAATSTPEKT